jgi:hypothetical protein
MDITETQAAYLAGLIDGEGSLECQKEWQPRGRTPRYTLRLSFTFATLEPLATVSEWLGVSYKRFPATDASRQDRYRAHVYKSLAVEVLGRCIPYLTLKRRQAEIILAIEAVRVAASPTRKHVGSSSATVMPESAIAEMDALHVELRSLKSNKHLRYSHDPLLSR